MGSHYSDAYEHDAEKARELKSEQERLNITKPKHLGVGKTISIDEVQDVLRKELEEAYNAGRDSVAQNFVRSPHEKEYNFENWYNHYPRKQSEYFRKYQKIAEAGFAPTDHTQLMHGIDYKAQLVRLNEKDEVKPYEEKFIVEINKTERVKLDDFRFKDEHTKIYFCKNNGNEYAQIFDTDPNKAVMFDTYQEAQESLIDHITRFYSSNKHYSGSVNKILIPRKNDLEKDFKIGDTVIACRRKWNLEKDGKEMEIISFSSYGYDEICVREKEDKEFRDWYWTNNFKKLENNENRI